MGRCDKCTVFFFLRIRHPPELKKGGSPEGSNGKKRQGTIAVRAAEKIHRSLQVGCFLRATITDLKMGEDVRCSSLIKISSHIQGESSSGSMTGDDAHRSTLPILLSFFSQSSRKSRRPRCNPQRPVARATLPPTHTRPSRRPHLARHRRAPPHEMIQHAHTLHNACTSH